MHTPEGTEGRGARCCSRAGSPAVALVLETKHPCAMLHRKQKQSTLGCETHVGTQREPTSGSTRKMGEACSPAWLKRALACWHDRDKTIAQETAGSTWGLCPAMEGTSFSFLGLQLFCSPWVNCKLSVSCMFCLTKGLEVHVCLVSLCTFMRNCKYLETVGWKE